MRPTPRLLSVVALPLGLGGLALLVACGGGSSTSGSGAAPSGQVAAIVTDSPSDQWSAVEVVVTKIALLDKTDHTRQEVVFNGASARINLVDLDSVGELLASASVPAGTYDALVVSIDTDPAKIKLVKADGTTVPASQIHVVGGSDVFVKLSTDLVVTDGSSNAVQVDFDLGHPLFLVQLPNGDWVLNLQLRHKPNPSMLSMMELRRHRGQVQSVQPDRFMMNTENGADLTIHVDAGARFINADTRSAGSFADLAPGKYLIASTRMQSNGDLYARWIIYSANPLPAWTPEGHVFGVDTLNGTFTVSSDTGAPVTLDVDPDTTFTFRTALALPSGAAGLADLGRGFKVQVTVKDPSASPLHAATVNIQRAVDGGQILAASGTDFTYHHADPLVADRTYACASPFTWWYLGFPGLYSTDPLAFSSAIAGAGDVRSQGVSDLNWNGTSSAWNASTAILLPVGLKGGISSGFDGTALGFTFTNSASVAETIPVALDTTVGMQPWVIEVHNQAGVVTVAPVASSDWSAKLVAGTPARVAVVPKADGTFSAYAVVIFTGF
ncbi:MAG TPA: DUF4382 domain-containing protein [Holophagaceae bacterium]|nr:DUF4382 domain-containing protein [Holophagaceae bacterium]